MNKNLTIEEQNLIKDILKVIGRDDQLNSSIAEGVGMEWDEFTVLADSIFEKLGNGRVTFTS